MIFNFLQRKMNVFGNVENHTKNLESQKNNLSSPKIQFLEYAGGHDTDLATFTQKFKYDYELDYEKTIRKLIDNGLLTYGNMSDTLSMYPLSELKSFLKSKGLPVSGKKDDLINRILTETSKFELSFTKKSFALTSKGKIIVDEYKKDLLDTLIDDTMTAATYIREGNYNRLIPIFERKPEPKNPISLVYDSDNIIKDGKIIKQYCDMGHNTDREIAISIITLMHHQPYKYCKKTLEKLGYTDIQDSEIYTISTSLHTLRNLDAFREVGIKRYKISTSSDGKVCAKCAKHNGKKYSVDKAVIGKTAPPFCEKCRCIIIAEL